MSELNDDQPILCPIAYFKSDRVDTIRDTISFDVNTFRRKPFISFRAGDYEDQVDRVIDQLRELCSSDFLTSIGIDRPGENFRHFLMVEHNRWKEVVQFGPLSHDISEHVRDKVSQSHQYIKSIDAPRLVGCRFEKNSLGSSKFQFAFSNGLLTPKVFESGLLKKDIHPARSSLFPTSVARRCFLSPKMPYP